jgi:hypothetical protein
MLSYTATWTLRQRKAAARKVVRTERTIKKAKTHRTDRESA